MIAFVSFIRAYAVWLYILCVLGILFGIKMLADARRLARTTLFSLEQERAGEQSYRAITLIVVLVLAMGAVTTVNVFIAPVVPTAEPPILRGATATLSAIIFPTSTPLPTFTPTLRLATETLFVTSTPVTVTPTRSVVKPTVPPPSPTAAPLLPLPAPIITGPVPNGGAWTGEGQANNNLVFKWNWECDQCSLGPNDVFVIVISYSDKASGSLMTISGTTKDKFLSLRRIIDGGKFEVYQKAQSNEFKWFVQVRRGDQPLTPQSETWKFIWN